MSGSGGGLPDEVARSFRCVPRLASLWETGGVLFYRHQFAAARRVLDEFGGSAILADEVGLGKTFEAGLVLRELLARGEVGSALVLVPASLVGQWQEEMKRFFGLSFTPEPWDPGGHPFVLASLDWVKRPPQRDRYLGQEWDVVIVDEAHRLKNAKTANHGFVASVRHRHLLLLTATPIENDLNELFNLVNLVRPGVFGSYMDFYRRFVVDRHTPRNQAALKEILGSVMVRTLRHEAGLRLPDREVALVPLELSEAERELYERVTAAVRAAYVPRRSTGGNLLPLIMVQREVCSSSFALLGTLERLNPEWMGEAATDVRDLARGLEDNVKARMALGFIKRLRERAIVFTEYRDTQEFLARRFTRAGMRVHVFNGSLPSRQKQEVRERFREEGGVLVSTEAGGLGVNLQFCRVVVNYDLPWNPMRIEQRIGRVHRLGQTEPVLVVNLFATRTVEEHLLRLLHQKIDLFRRVIGDLDVILRDIERQRPLEMQLFEIFFTARDEAAIEAELEHIQSQFNRGATSAGTERDAHPEMVY